LRGVSEKASLGYTKPKTEAEERAGELFSDISSMAIPGAAQYSAMRNIGIPIVANMAKEGLKYFEISEGKQNAAKVAIMIGLDLITHRRAISGSNKLLGEGAKGYAGKLYSQAAEAIPEGAQVEAKGLATSLDAVENELRKGGTRPSTQKALEKVRELKSDIVDGKIQAENLFEYRPAINEMIEELGGFEVIKNKKIKERAVHNLNQVKSKVIDALEDYGKKENPQFLTPYRQANEAYAVAEKSNKISNLIKKKFGSTLKSKGAKMLFGIPTVASGATAYLVPSLGALTGSIGALGAGAYQAHKLLYRIAKSPTLAKYYGKILQGSLAGNVSQVSKNLKALDHLLLQEEKSNED